MTTADLDATADMLNDEVLAAFAENDLRVITSLSDRHGVLEWTGYRDGDGLFVAVQMWDNYDDLDLRLQVASSRDADGELQHRTEIVTPGPGRALSLIETAVGAWSKA